MKINKGRRGSTFLLVLAMLSILVLIAAALSYNSRMENIASTNFAALTQARVAAATGLPAAVPLLLASTGPTTPLQAWNQSGGSAAGATTSTNALASRARTTRASMSKRDNNAPVSSDSGNQYASQAKFSIEDLSGRVNINTISSEHAFQRFLQAVYSSGNKEASQAVGLIKTQGLFAYRGTKPGTTVTLQPDLRKHIVPGTRRFESLNDLKAQKSRSRSVFRDEDITALSGYMTVFSQSPEQFNNPDGTTLSKVSLSNLTPEGVYEVLRQAFPTKSTRLLRQFAANTADYADADDRPTSMTDPEHPEPWNLILGSEQAPLITEVYPDSNTSDEFNDAGQFVEIYNPWNKPMTMTNWRLAVASGAGGISPGGAVVTINAIIPSGGYLIITDNYQSPSDDSPPETGSFLSIFGTKADNAGRRLIEDAGLNLPDSNSYITLLDSGGAVIDIFSYTTAAGEDGKRSYQRDDPRVRSFKPAEATPFVKPGTDGYTGTPVHEAAMRDIWKRGNSGLSSPVDLLYVPSAYVDLQSVEQAAILQAHPWQFPLFLQESPDTNLGLHLVDLFTTVEPTVEVDQQAARTAETETASRTTRSGAQKSFVQRVRARTAGSGVLRATDAIPTPETEAASGLSTTGTLYAYGKLNLNTCSKVALAGLDGEVEGQDAITNDLIERIEKFRMQKLSEKKTPFNNVSDLLPAIFPKPTEKDLKLFARLVEQVTVNSSSFEIAAENRVPETDKKVGARSATIMKQRWTVALDRAPYSLIQYSIDR